MSDSIRDQSLDAARAGLDFLVRHQLGNRQSADFGRFPYCFDRLTHRSLTLTTNWTTGIAIEALLAGHGAFAEQRYRDAADYAAAYLKSLQYFDPVYPRVHGVFREVTPRSGMAHPRDALTAAWALLDWSQLSGDRDALRRATIYADWFTTVGLEKGYPYWTVRFDAEPWEPGWCGSFHSGSAFFLYRMYQATGREPYRAGMRSILDFYNRHHLDADGRVTVILDRSDLQPLDGKADPRFSNAGWEMMHVYNDDFGALANLAAWQVENDEAYFAAAERFLQRMLRSQRPDGGFGPEDRSIPSAGGAVLLELLAAESLGRRLASQEQLERAARYLMSTQIRQVDSPSDGAFLGFDDHYTLSQNVANIRSGAYAILALLRFAGIKDPYYFFPA